MIPTLITAITVTMAGFIAMDASISAFFAIRKKAQQHKRVLLENVGDIWYIENPKRLPLGVVAATLSNFARNRYGLTRVAANWLLAQKLRERGWAALPEGGGEGEFVCYWYNFC